MLSLNCKNVQHVKIYLPCNFEVNPITHFGVIALFSSNILKLEEEKKIKKGNNSKMGTQIYFKIAGYVDLDILNMFAV
jgi:hypothetical protein